LQPRLRRVLWFQRRARRGAGAGFSISLTDMTFERGSNLSAAAAPFGAHGPVELLKNGSYNETLTGDYAVFDNLPPSDQSLFWQTFTQISLRFSRLISWSGRKAKTKFGQPSLTSPA
jgi:hypothetical protein